MNPEHPQHSNDVPTPGADSAEVDAAVSGSDSAPSLVMQPSTDPTGHLPLTGASKRFENPLLTILGAAVVLLLGFALTHTNDRISRLEDKVDTGFAQIDARFTEQDTKIEARFAEQDAKFEARFAEQDAKFEAQDAKIEALDAKLDEINLKLTALIALLNSTAQVEAALEGQLLDPG